MKILAIESSSRQRSVALCSNEGECRVLASADARSERGSPLASLVEKVLILGKTSRKEIGKIAVGVGPGSAAGIRSTLAFAIGWQMASNIKVIGVSSVWTLAAEARIQGIKGNVEILLAASAGRLYHNGFFLSDSEIREMHPLSLISVNSFLNSKWIRNQLIGEGVIILKKHCQVQKYFLQNPILENPILPTARALCILAAEDIESAQSSLEAIHLVSPSFVKIPRDIA